MDAEKDSPEFAKKVEKDDKKYDSKKISTSEESTKNIQQEKDKKHDEPATFFIKKKSLEPNHDNDRPPEADYIPDESETLAEEQEERLSEKEVHEAVVDIVNEKESALADDLPAITPETPEELALIAEAAFLAAVKEKAENTDRTFTDDDIQEAYRETVEDLELDTQETNDDTAEIDPETSEFDEEDESLASQATASPPPPPIIQSPITPGGNPPLPPTPPPRPSYSPPPPPQIPSSFQPGNQMAPMHVSSHNAVSAASIGNRNRRRNDLLIGAVIGYIIGRRGGRKRTEKKLLPKIDTLEKEVHILHNAISTREEKIRKLALNTAKKAMHSENTTPQKGTESPTIVHDKLLLLANKRNERVHIREKQQSKERIDAAGLHEKIGAMKLHKLEVFLEKRLLDGNENHPKRKAVEIMTEGELLEKIGSLEIDGLKVSDAFARKQIDIEVLREITKRYLRSGDYERVFRYELKASSQELSSRVQHIEKLHEKQFSADPELGNVADTHSHTEHQPSSKNGAEYIKQTSVNKSKMPKDFIQKPWVVAVVFGVLVALGLLITLA